MKTCTLSGDMLSDSTSEQYPTVNLCDACHKSALAEAERSREDTVVNTSSTYDPALGECAICGTTADEEAQARE